MSSPCANACDQAGVARDVRQDAQFDLRIVRADQLVAGRGDERAPDLPAQFGADGDVLQIWIRRRDATGDRAGLVVVGVDAAGARQHQRRQRVDVRSLQLGEFAVLEDQRDDRMRAAQRFQDVRGGRDLAGLCLG